MATILNFPIEDFRSESYVQDLHIRHEAAWQKFLQKTGEVTAKTAEMNEAHMAYLALNKELQQAMERLAPTVAS